ncbi:hypothetical protein EB796_019961 [Bugula neritina]|uniref:Uncharacterized protein n=1 Tax=Bugula neritina TaxID=10212 RepID=A0A7J7J676_BUGNE|nr:hypothetical protein EB796_019961 [Bugula neritina]
MATNSSADVLIFCGGEQFCSLLGDDSLEKKKDWVDLILILINKALSCETHHHYKQQLVSVLLENEATFFSKICVTRFTAELVSFTGMKIDSLTESLDNYLKVFHHLCALDPLASKTLVTGVSTVKLLLQGKSSENDHLKHVTQLYMEALEEMEKKEKEEKELALRKAKLAKTGRVVTSEKPETSFREMSVYPTEEDLEEDVELRKNNIDGRKSSKL